MYPKILICGAESVITQIDAQRITKQRLKKGYRVKELDVKFTTHRTRSEAKILTKLAEAGLPVPKLYDVNEDTNTLTLEYIDGVQVKEVLSSKNTTTFATIIGKLIADLHNCGIIHADLTTSNLLYANNTITIIDFGLSYMSTKREDKAVDLHLLHQSLTSYHAPIASEVMRKIISVYEKNAQDAVETLKRYNDVEKRGRNKH